VIGSALTAARRPAAVARRADASRRDARRADARCASDDARERADLELLTGADAGRLVAAVLEAEGVTTTRWAVHQVHHRPGVGVTVGWTVSWWTGGRTGEEYLLGTTAPMPPGTPGSTTVRVDAREVTVWRHPADPALPGLAAACDPAAVAGWLGPEVGTLELVTYRPLRRAVLRAGRGPARTYLKVVRPHTAELLHLRHQVLRAAGVPAARSVPLPDGVLLLDELPGRPLTEALAVDGGRATEPGRVVELLDRLPRAAMGLPRRPAWSERVRQHAAAAAAALPDRAEEVEHLGRVIEARVRSTDPGPLVPTHGDLYEANLLVDDGRIVGLLDVDALGPGHRVDDLACLLGHLSVLPALAPEVHRHVPAALPRWTAAFEGLVDPAALRARAAGVAMSLVAGARQDGGGQRAERDWRADADRRLAAVHGWLDGMAR